MVTIDNDGGVLLGAISCTSLSHSTITSFYNQDH